MTCDNCKKPAEYNLQSGLFLWTLDRKGNYSKAPVEFGVDDIINYHLCEKHYDECEERI